MKLCDSCKNNGTQKKCEIYGRMSNYAEKCKDYKEKKPSNADQIRSMSDEELAALMGKAVFCGRLVENETSSEDCRGCKQGFCSNILNWLKSESEE